MKPLVLCILDGCGIREESFGNAFLNANKPTFDYLWNKYPHSLLDASSTSVGLPIGQMGNSEVGHMNIGAGRVVYQPLELINKKIDDKTFFSNKEILDVINYVNNNNSKLHIMGLVSDGGVHSHINHLLALLDMCKENNVSKVYLHLFTDGRDVSPTSAYKYISMVEDKINELKIGAIATIHGRYYAMDRDNNYDRLKKSYDASIYGIGPVRRSVKEFIEESYEKGITDEFLIPTIFNEDGKVEDKDGVITFNFRKDRIREMFTALTNPNFDDFSVIKFGKLKVLTMLPVVESVMCPYAFNIEELNNILGEYLSKNNLSQLRISETEKYAHVTFFFDGGKEITYDKEDKILIPSPKVKTYDMMPSMSAPLITSTLLKELDKDYYDVIILNYANGDMVGHTGNYDATIKAIETLDSCLKDLYNKVMEKEGTLIVTSDHGNSDMMFDKENNIITSHTTSLVPFIITKEGVKLNNGVLADIAPTMLYLLGIKAPKEMTGKNLIKE